MAAKRLTLNGALVVAVVTLAGAVGALWLESRSTLSDMREQMKACQEDRQALWESNAALWFELFKLKMGLE